MKVEILIEANSKKWRKEIVEELPLPIDVERAPISIFPYMDE